MRSLLPAALLASALPALAGETAIEAGGTSYPAIVAGEGSPVVFVHGMLGDSRAWRGVEEATVGAGHRFVAYDQRGFGTSAWPEASFSRDRHTADLGDILATLGEPVDLVGWSYSGPILLRVAAEKPDQVRRVVLFEPFVPEMLGGTPEADAAAEAFDGIWGPTAAAMEAGDTEGATRAAVEAVLGLGDGGFAKEPPAIREMQEDNAASFAAFWNGGDKPKALTCDELGKVRAPTLIVTGATTLPAFAEMAKAVAGCLPHAATAVMEGVGHGGPIEDADAFGKLALGFIGAP